MILVTRSSYERRADRQDCYFVITIEDLQCPLCGGQNTDITDEYPDADEPGLHPLDAARCHSCGHQGTVGAFIG